MGFRLVQKSVTLNDLESCNGHFFALFHYVSTPTKHDGRAVLFAVAELLVLTVVDSTVSSACVNSKSQLFLLLF